MPRQLAWEVLRSGSVTPMREVDVAAREVGLDARDRGLLRAIVGHEVRHRGTLRTLVNAFARGKPKPGLRTHLHVGFAQLLYMDRVPPRAVVSEQVDATRRTLGASKTTYVNAVLRTLIRERRPGHSGDPTRDLVDAPWHFERPLFHDPEEHPALWAEDALSIPGHLFKRWLKRHGFERAATLGRHFLAGPDLSLRCAGDRDELRAELEAALAGREDAGELELLDGHHDAILLARGDLSGLFDTPAFAEGRATVQGESALVAAELVEATAGESVLDLCAAPGGKTAVLAATGADVVAVDVSEAKLARLRETLERLGLAGRVEPVLATPRERTDEDLPGFAPGPADYAGLGDRTFDAVLVDAPCSNTGVLGARPGARWRFGPANQKALVDLQATLLREGAARVRPGGRLVWSTCSIETDENQQQVKRFLAEHTGWELDAEHEALPGPTSDGGPVDGGFCARLRRA